MNLGAGTHNSDLRNDYGEVSVVIGGESVRTGLGKIGCFIGDHAKTGLGTLLNTGSTIGAFCNLLPAGRYAPKYMPSFTAPRAGVRSARASSVRCGAARDSICFRSRACASLDEKCPRGSLFSFPSRLRDEIIEPPGASVAPAESRRPHVGSTPGDGR